MTWQPIESHPKSHKIILVDFGKNGVRAAYWHQPGNKTSPGFWVIFGGHTFKKAYGWMHLPESPEIAELHQEAK